MTNTLIKQIVFKGWSSTDITRQDSIKVSEITMHVGQMAYEKIPAIENFCRCKTLTQYVEAEEQIYKEERTLFADSSFFDIFSYPVISGNKDEFLRSPNVAVITESTARKYFGNENPVGQTIYGVNPGRKPVTVQGVVKDVRTDSHLKFDIVISLSTLTDKSYCYTLQ